MNFGVSAARRHVANRVASWAANWTVLTAIAVAAGLSVPGLASSGAAAQERAEFNLSRQPGLIYLPNQVMEDGKLVEKQAEKLGLKDLKVNYLTFTSGGVSTDTLLAGQVDVVTSGYSNMLLIWAKTNGGVKALAGVGGNPLYLITRNPDIKTIKDFKPTDRIAVPTLRQSMQSTILGIALDQAYGPGNHNRLDDIQVQIGHPEATQALLNKSHEINAHFSIPPYSDTALRSADPKVHVVLESFDALGGAAHIACAYTTQKFVDGNPMKVKAFLAALDEANELIAKDPRAAIAAYIRVTKDKGTPEDLLDVVTRKGSLYTATPTRSMLYADQMFKTGLLKTKPTSWKDFHFDVIHDRPGS